MHILLVNTEFCAVLTSASETFIADRYSTVKSKTFLLYPFQQDVFDHMWAAEDYEVFKRLMIQKNIELQLQALQLLQQVHNVQMPMPIPMQNQIPMPVSVAPPNSVPMAPSSSVPPPPGADEDAIMQEVLRRSKEEFESKQKDAKAKTEQEFERTLAESTEESKR